MEMKQARINPIIESASIGSVSEEMRKDKQKQLAVYCYEQRLLSHIRSVKLVREIGNGTQRRLAEWVS